MAARVGRSSIGVILLPDSGCPSWRNAYFVAYFELLEYQVYEVHIVCTCIDLYRPVILTLIKYTFETTAWSLRHPSDVESLVTWCSPLKILRRGHAETTSSRIYIISGIFRIYWRQFTPLTSSGDTCCGSWPLTACPLLCKSHRARFSITMYYFR